MPLRLAVQQEEAAYGAALEGLIGAGMIDVREAIGMADTHKLRKEMTKKDV